MVNDVGQYFIALQKHNVCFESCKRVITRIEGLSTV